MSNVFKAYSAKAKAKRALLSKIADANPDLYLQMGGEGDELQWGFMVDEAGNPATIAATEPEQIAPEPELENDEPTWAGLNEPEPAPANNIWGQLAGNHTVPDSARNVQKGPRVPVEGKIEKNRPEQNGVKQPSRGTTCRQIWDTLQEQYDAGNLVSLADLRVQLVDKQGLDRTTVQVQYYRWRKFTGIKGRTAPAA